MFRRRLRTAPVETFSDPCHASLCARYARCDRLRGLANLVVVGGVVSPDNTGDREEAAECQKMHGEGAHTAHSALTLPDESARTAPPNSTCCFCARAAELYDQFHLDGCVRWVVAQKNRVRNGELYRYIADLRGAFVQPVRGGLDQMARCRPHPGFSAARACAHHCPLPPSCPLLIRHACRHFTRPSG